MITKDELASRLLSACAEVKAAEGELTEIDSRFGDADHGLTMCKIATAIEESVRESEGGIQAMLDDVAMAVMTLNGGSAVPLWNTWLDGRPSARRTPGRSAWPASSRGLRRRSVAGGHGARNRVGWRGTLAGWLSKARVSFAPSRVRRST